MLQSTITSPDASLKKTRDGGRKRRQKLHAEGVQSSDATMLQSSKQSRTNTTCDGRRNRRQKPRAEVVDSLVVRRPNADLLMENITFLKRGQELCPSPHTPADILPDEPEMEDTVLYDDEHEPLDLRMNGEDRVAFSGDLQDQDPKQVKFADRVTIYAGSGFSSSPSPSSLPFPAFFMRKGTASASAINDLATKDICRLLRLNLL